MATALERQISIGIGPRPQRSGNEALIDTLRRWGVTFFAGVNGGGLIHVNKHLEPFDRLEQSGDGVPRMLTMGEYVAGFVPQGHWYATRRVAGCVTTTGAATKLGSSGITDAKLQNIPAVYLVALNSTSSIGKGPLQDVSEDGANIVPQLQAELGDGCVVIDNIHTLDESLRRAQRVLLARKPVAIAFRPDVLSQDTDAEVAPVAKLRTVRAHDVDALLAEFPQVARGRRVVLYVGGEAATSPGIQPFIARLARTLRAATVWTANGANAVAADHPYGYGHMSFGGNDRAAELWNGIGPDDIVIALGFDPGEYALNLRRIEAGWLWHFSDLSEPWGHRGGEFRHRVRGEYRRVRGDIARALEEILPRLEAMDLGDRPEPETHADLNTREVWRDVAPDRVDLVDFYQRIHRLWRPDTIGFDDTCIAYKDRQYVTQRPHPEARFFSNNDGSAMGAGFGLGVGAKCGDPSLHTFVFTGDGCWRLFGGALADAQHLDLRVFIVNNGTYGIVDKGLEVVVPDVPKRRYHSRLRPIDFVGAAKAHGWDAVRLSPDLSDLEDVMDACYERRGRSMLIDLPVDPDQVVGLNPRLYNLTTTTYL